MTKMKKSAVAFSVACALTLTGGLAVLKTLPAVADEGVTIATEAGYYGKQLKDQTAIAFYNELVEMTKPKPTAAEGLSEFRRGVDHEVKIGEDSVITAEMVEAAFENESRQATKTLIKNFGAALDSFRYDFADLFYINFDSLTFDITRAEVVPDDDDDDSDGPEALDEPLDEEGPEYEYKLIIGAGRGKSYFIEGVTMEELNAHKVDSSDDDSKSEDDQGEPSLQEEPGDEPGEGEGPSTPDTPTESPIPTDHDGMYVEYEAHLTKFVEIVAEASTVKDKALAVNNAICEAFRYGYDYDGNGKMDGVDAYVGTTYSLVTTKKTGAHNLANSEGLARVFKTVLAEIDDTITCVLVSGYYLEEDGTTIPWMWNYVQDSGVWYAVDVAHNLIAKSNVYFWQQGDTFYFDHFEEGVISLLNYRIEYPKLLVKDIEVDTGDLLIAKGTYEDGADDDKVVREGLAVKYVKSDSETLKIRVKKEDGSWSDWMELEEYEKYDPSPVVPEPEPTEPDEPDEPQEPAGDEGASQDEDETGGGEGGDEGGGSGSTEPETKPEPKYDLDESAHILYLYHLEEGQFEVGIFAGNVRKTSTGKVRETLNYVSLTEESIKNAQKVQTITGRPIEIKIAYDSDVPLKIPSDVKLGVEFTISSPFGRTFNEEEVRQCCALTDLVENLSDNIFTFKFTPSSRLDHNGLCYTFKFTNIASEDDGALLMEYSLVFAIGSIRAGKVSNNSNTFVDNVIQPTLAYNNNISVEGWTYDGGKAVTENMLFGISLSVNRPSSDAASKMSEAVKGLYPAKVEGETEIPVLKAQDIYTATLSFEGKPITLPEGASLQLAFPYPEGCGPTSNPAVNNIVYKVIQFAAASNGAILEDSYKVLDVVPLRQGLVVEVNQLSFFAVVAIDATQYEGFGNEKIVLLQTSGVGGTVTVDTNKLINVLHSEDAITFTFTPSNGYEIDYVLLNGVDKKPNSGNTLSLNYATLTGKDVFILYVEFIQTSVKTARGDAVSVSNNFAKQMGDFQINGGPYDEEDDDIVRDYPSIMIPGMPPEPWFTGSYDAQKYILAGVVGGIALIGAVSIIYFGAIKPKKIREQKEEEARLAAAREKKANRNRMGPGGPGAPGGMGGPRNYPPMR